MTTEKKNKPNRWDWHPDRWESAEQASQAHTDFLHGAMKLIGRKANPSVWSEAEALGMRLVTHLGLNFHGVPARWAVVAMREALEAFERQPTIERRRAYCVEDIAEAGEDWKRPEWQATEETRNRRLGALANNLAFYDEKIAEAFPNADADFSILAERIAAFDPAPAGKRDAKGAEKILAEIIVLDVPSGALGFEIDENANAEDEIERVRKALAKSVRELFEAANPVENKP